MKRRDTILGIFALGVTDAPLVMAQPANKLWRIGFLSNARGPDEPVEAFIDQLKTLGYHAGRNLMVEYRWGAGNETRLAELAAELVRLKVDVIVTRGQQAVAVAKRATATIPIVMATAADPVGTGIVASLARPGGNITGISIVSTDLAAKRVQLLREVLPTATAVAVLALKGRCCTEYMLMLAGVALAAVGTVSIIWSNA